MNNQANTTPNDQEAHDILEVVNFCNRLKLQAEQVGHWVWVTFQEKPKPFILKALKDFGFRWSRRRGKWAHNCGSPSMSGQGDPWQKYPHCVVSQESPQVEESVPLPSYREIRASEDREQRGRFDRIAKVKDNFYDEKGQ